MPRKKETYKVFLYGFTVICMFSAINATTCSPNNSNEDNKNITVSSSSGTITSPGFPSSIPNAPLECIWKLQAPVGQAVRLDLDSVDLRFPPGTAYSVLYVKTGGVGDLYKVYQLTGMTGTTTVLSSDGRNMWIEYSQTADVSKVSKRPPSFSIRYSMIPIVTSGSCSANSKSTIALEGEGSSFQTPNYPNSPSNMTCLWNITVPDGMLVKLRLDTSLTTLCNEEWVRVYDGATTGSPVIIKVCEYLNRIYYSTGNVMLVEQVTKPGTSVRGFNAVFTAVKVAPKNYSCTYGNEDRGGMQGKIASQGFPVPYSNWADCKWTITVPFRHRVNLTFTSFSLQDDPGCTKDYVQVTVKDLDLYDKELPPMCGNRTEFTVSSMDNHMTVRFRSDLTGRFPGFEAEYTAILDPTFGSCTEQGQDNLIPMTTPTGVFKTPRYPGKYPGNMMCTWVITAKQDQYVRLIFLRDFQLNTCDKSKVEVREGDSKGKVIGKFCGATSPPVIFSSGRVLWVQFWSSQNSDIYSRRGFTANYEIVPNLPLSISCTDERNIVKVTGETGSLASYEYPLKYQNNVKCIWLLSIDSSSKCIRLSFDEFELESSDGCKADYVEVRDGGTPSSELQGRYCGKTKPDPVTSSDSLMYVTFYSNGNITSKGFKASYESTYTTKTVVLIAVFSVIGAIAVIALIGWMCKCWLSNSGGDSFPKDNHANVVPLE